jgi:CRP-like cAMP-binding protein
MNDLVEAIRELASPMVPQEGTLQTLAHRVTERDLERGQHLTRAGEVADNLYFVRSGLLRYYYLSDDKEHTGQFFDSGAFVADLSSINTGAPTQQFVEALEPSLVVSIPVSALQEAYDTDHAMERFGRRLVEAAMAGSQRRSANLLVRTPEQRYDTFLRTRPEVAGKVAQYMMASYLGITPESLSRIRARRVSRS